MKTKVEQKFFIGSKWLYYKLYMGSQVSDTFITKTLVPVTDYLLKNKIISKWFFINYNDPDRHVRVRFEINEVEKNISYVLKILHQALKPYLESRAISKIQIDTYKRELQRYGNETIEESETIFFDNSLLITYILANIKNENERWLWGLKAMDVFLEAWNLTIEQKMRFFETLKNAYGEEMGTNTALNRQLSKKYRNNRQMINEIMEQPLQEQFHQVLEDYKQETKKTISEIAKKRKLAKSNTNIVDILESYIHMHCNRLFKSNHRVNEWVLYYFSFQYYRSRIAQLKNKPKELVK